MEDLSINFNEAFSRLTSLKRAIKQKRESLLARHFLCSLNSVSLRPEKHFQPYVFKAMLTLSDQLSKSHLLNSCGCTMLGALHSGPCSVTARFFHLKWSDLDGIYTLVMQEKSSSANARWHTAKPKQLISSSVKGKPINLLDFLDLRLGGQGLDISQATDGPLYLWLCVLK